MQSCYDEISKNIQMDCNSPMVAGYTGRALLFPAGTYEYSNTFMPPTPEYMKGAKPFDPVVGATFYAIDNVFVDPFSGSTTQSNGESGRVQFQKTLNIRIPMRGQMVSQDIVEAMHNSADGYVLLVEKKNHNNDGGAFELIGLSNPMKPTADGTARNEGENGGDITMTLQTTEPYFEKSFFYGRHEEGVADPIYDYQAAKAHFDLMYAGAGEPWQEPE